MYLPIWLRIVRRRLFGLRPAAPRRRYARKTVRLRLEALEDRLVPSSNIGLVANNGSSSATVFDPTTNTALGSVSIPNNPVAVGDTVITNNGTLAFVSGFNSELTVLDLSNPSTPTLASGINQIPIANPGEHITITPDQQFLVVTDGSGTTPISVVNVASRTQVSTLSLGTDIESSAASNTGSVFVGSAFSNVVRELTIDGSGTLTDTGKSMSATDPNNIYLAPGDASGVVVSFLGGSVESFLTSSLTPVDTRSVTGGQAICAVINPAGNMVYVRSSAGFVDAFGYDSTTGQLSSSPLFTISVALATAYFGMDQMTISQDGSELYVPDDSNNSIDVFDATTGSRLATITGSSISDPTGITIPIPQGTAATVTGQNATATFSTNKQTLALTADVSSTQTVNEGTVTFTVKDSNGNTVGSPVKGNVTGGVATANFTLPAHTPAGTYAIDVSYSDSSFKFFDNGDTSGTLTITPAKVSTSANDFSTYYSPNTQTLALTANLADNSFSSDVVDEGKVTFTVKNGSKIIGTATANVSPGSVSGGTATANLTLPAGQIPGSYTIVVSYFDSAGNFLDNGDTPATLTVSPASVTTTAANVLAVYSTNPQTVALSASVADDSIPSDKVGEGSVTFTIEDSNGKTVGNSVNVGVSGGQANADYTLPPGQAVGSYIIAVSYSDSTGYILDGGDKSGTLDLAPARVAVTANNPPAVFYNSSAQNISLSAQVADTSYPKETINEGTVTFTVLNGNTPIGTPVYGVVVSGTASAVFTAPAGLALGSYTIAVTYNDSAGNYTDSGDTNGTLTVTHANVAAAAGNASLNYSTKAQTATLNASVSVSPSSNDIVNEGVVVFTVAQGSTLIGNAQGTVSGGTASATFPWSAGRAAGNYTIAVHYSDSSGDYVDSSDASGILTVSPAHVAVTASNPPAVVHSSNAQNITLTAAVADTTYSSDTVNEGFVAFTVKDSKGNTIGNPVQGNVTGGTASAVFTLPAGQAAGSYTIAVAYSDSAGNFSDSRDNNGALTVSSANVAVTANNAAAVYSPNPNGQNVTLSASVANLSVPSQPVGEGVVTFTVLQGSAVIGKATTSGTVTNGVASVSYTLPAGLAPGSYTLEVSYSDSTGNFRDSGDTNALLTVSPANVTTTANNLAAFYSPNVQTLTLSATVADAGIPTDTVGEGVVTFTVQTSNTTLGSVQSKVKDGKAVADFTLPAGQAVGSYILAVSYSDSAGNFRDSGDTNALLTVSPANVATTAANIATVYRPNLQTLALSATVADASIATDKVDEGVVSFTIKNGGTTVGNVQAAVKDGTADTNFALAAGQAAGSYTIAVSYSDSAVNFSDNGDTNDTLTISPANVTATANVASAVYSTSSEIVKLSANVVDNSVPGDTVTEGVVTFTVKSGSTILGSVQGTVAGGTANAALTLPAGLTPGSYSVAASYSDSNGNFISSSGGGGSAPLTVGSANVATTAVPNSAAVYSQSAQTVTLHANVADASVPSDTINQGVVTFTILNGSTQIGSAQGTVSGGTASANITLPAGLAAGNYTLAVSYSDSQGYFSDGGDTYAALTVSPAGVATTAAAAQTTFRSTAQTVTLSASVAEPGPANSVVGEGYVTFTVLSGNTVVASAPGAVNGGTASAALTLPGGLAAGTYTLAVSYSDNQGNFSDNGDTNATLTIGAAGTSAQLTQATLAPTLLSLTATETLTAHVSSSSPVTQGTVTFFVSNHAITANVDGNGNAVAVVTLPMLQLLGPQDISLRYNDAANNLTPSTDAETAAWRVFNPIVPSTATFAPNEDSVTADLFGLFITYTNGVLTEIDYGSIHLVFSYNAAGGLAQVTFDGMNLL
jgi:hypothetical protein